MKKNPKKEKYEKPVLKSIQLHADEVLVVGCKNGSTSGRLLATCQGTGASCRGSGS